MLLLTPPQTATLRDRFLPDWPGPLVGLHVIQTGHGACFADRWPAPRALLTDTAGNYAFTGDPAALAPAAVTFWSGGGDRAGRPRRTTARACGWPRSSVSSSGGRIGSTSSGPR